MRSIIGLFVVIVRLPPILIICVIIDRDLASIDVALVHEINGPFSFFFFVQGQFSTQRFTIQHPNRFDTAEVRKYLLQMGTGYIRSEVAYNN